jgi:signal transduction histidine kinase/HAMP domain-containing protein
MKARTSPRHPPKGRFMSLRTKFVAFVSLIIVAVCSGLSWYFIEQQAQSLTRALTETGILLVKNLAHNSRYASITEDKTDLQQFVDGVMEDEEIVYAVITKPDGERMVAKSKGRLIDALALHRSPDLPLYPDTAFVASRLTDASTEPFVVQFRPPGGKVPETIYDFTAPIIRRTPSLSDIPLPFSLETEEDRQKGKLRTDAGPKTVSVVQIGLTAAKRQQALNAAVKKVILITLFFILLGIGATGVLADRIIDPLKGLAVVAKRVAEGDLTASAEPTTHDEVGELTTIFNRMTESLKERDAAISSQIQTITKQVTQLTTLNQAGAAITSMLDVDKLLTNVLRLLHENLGYERILIMLYDPYRGVAYGARTAGVPEDIERAGRDLEFPISEDGSLNSDLLIHGRALLIPNLQTISARVHPVLSDAASRLGVSCFVGAPLKSTQRILGFIAADRGDVLCSQEDLDLLVTLASQIAVAIDNAQAYHELQQLTQTLERRVQDRTQELVTANEKLQELDRLKSAFVSIVSHELRTPMTSIKGYVENMLDGLTGGLNEKQSYYLSRVKFNVERLTRMINDLLDLSRIEAGRVELVVAPIPVADLLGDIMESLQPIAQAKGVALQYELHGEPVPLQADRDKLHQVLTNLTQNAVKFTPKGGEVRLSVQRRDDGYVQFCVADTGCGIAAHEIGKVFERFYRGETVRADQRGAGLGLAITKSLVELHGGGIWVESTLGQGSRFCFLLPTLPSSQ